LIELALVGEEAVIEETKGATLSTATVVPVVNVAGERAFPAASRMVWFKSLTSSRIVPDAAPVFTVTVREEPEPEMVPIEAPGTLPVVVSVKSPATTGETGSENVTV
jgi:hypothetical protein